MHKVSIVSRYVNKPQGSYISISYCKKKMLPTRFNIFSETKSIVDYLPYIYIFLDLIRFATSIKKYCCPYVVLVIFQIL